VTNFVLQVAEQRFGKHDSAGAAADVHGQDQIEHLVAPPSEAVVPVVVVVVVVVAVVGGGGSGVVVVVKDVALIVAYLCRGDDFCGGVVVVAR
jgi:hypothetical protein